MMKEERKAHQDAEPALQPGKQPASSSRVLAFAVTTLFLSGMIFAMGLGPIIIGGLNDLLKPAFGPLAIRYSLLTGAATSVIGAAFFLAAVRHLQADMERNMVEQ